MNDPDREKETHPLSGVMEFWENVMADMEATAAEYREAGWTVTELHPGDVTPVPARVDTVETGRVGLDVLVPGDEFDAVEDVVGRAAFDAYDAYRAERGDVVFAVVVMQAEDAGEAVAVPVYYTKKEASPMLERVDEDGEMRLYVRPLSGDRRVVFVQSDPEALLPVDDGGDEDA
ncbi:DUF7529 family protein [Halogeometricum limi]|uniref:Uncharacterized protein n=1 Tax=Halogeometricum limi TaxID=555875 RepID=A0A1I6ITG3_9EURY|nr:hypothetical protein [Halogeometricum limi]SFR70034.1 hypothetical protein SAMN04488124_3643 [Halogeometricum limi]